MFGGIEMAGTSEPAQRPSTHLLLYCSEVLRCQRAGLGELDLPVLAGNEHPVDHAAVEVNSASSMADEAR